MSDDRPKFDWEGYVAGYMETLKRPRIKVGGEEEQAALVDLHERLKRVEDDRSVVMGMMLGEREAREAVAAELIDLRARVAQFAEWLKDTSQTPNHDEAGGIVQHWHWWQRGRDAALDKLLELKLVKE